MKTLPPELKGKKVSDAFMEYVEPFLKQIMSDGSVRTSAQIEKALQIPWSVWNAIEFDKKIGGGQSFMNQMEQLFNHMPGQGKEMIKSLKERKKKHFSQYSYILGEYSIYVDEKNQEVRASVEARLP